MPRKHPELTCWQLPDELRQLIVEHTKNGRPAAQDLRFTSNLRDAIASACRKRIFLRRTRPTDGRTVRPRHHR